MEQILHLAETWYMRYTSELVLGLLTGMLILMIITLLAVKKCRKQVQSLSDKTRDMLKLALSQREEAADRRREPPRDPQTERGGHAATREDEELFGSVIQEMFS